MALPKSHRLSLRFSRDHLIKTGKTEYGKFFTVISTTPEIETINSRFAILLSKKTAPQAVDRNRIKRITSSMLEPLIKTLPIKDYLIIPKKQVLFETASALTEDLKTLFHK